MRNFVTATLVSAALVTGPALAGGMAPAVMEEEVVQEETAAGSRAGILVPILALVFIALAMSNNGDDPFIGASDARLKTDITRVGTAANGLPLYHFRYIGQSTVYEGVMAQDVLAHTPEAVVTLPGGYLAVNYGLLGLEMKTVH